MGLDRSETGRSMLDVEEILQALPLDVTLGLEGILQNSEK